MFLFLKYPLQHRHGLLLQPQPCERTREVLFETGRHQTPEAAFKKEMFEDFVFFLLQQGCYNIQRYSKDKKSIFNTFQL